MVLTTKHSYHLASMIKHEYPSMEEGVRQLHKSPLNPKDHHIQKRQMKSFFFISVTCMVLLFFSAALRYQVLQESIEKEERILNHFVKEKGHTKQALTTDNLSWNYIHIIDEQVKERKKEGAASTIPKEILDE